MINQAAFNVYKNPVVLTTMTGTFLLKLVSFLCIPFMAIFLSKYTSLSAAIVGVLVGLNQVGSLAAGFVSGVLADRLGRRLILLVGLFGTAAIFLFFFLASATLGRSLLFTLVFAVLNISYGILSALFWPLTQVLMADTLPKEDRATVFRHRYALTNIAAGVGPPLGAFLGIASGRVAFVVSGACYLVFGVAFWWLTRIAVLRSGDSPSERRSFGGALRVLGADRAFRKLTLSMIIFGLGYVQVESTLSRVLTAYPGGVELFSILLTVNALAVVLLQPVANLVLRRASAGWTVLAGNLMFALACLPFSYFGYGRIRLIALVVLISLAEVLIVPTASVLLDELAPPTLRATYFGASTLRNLGLGLGPSAGGLVLTWFGARGLFTFMGVCGLAATILVRPPAGKVSHADPDPAPEQIRPHAL